jgi:hypothetical protein
MPDVQASPTALTEESKLAKVARDAQDWLRFALNLTQSKFPLEPPE